MRACDICVETAPPFVELTLGEGTPEGIAIRVDLCPECAEGAVRDGLVPTVARRARASRLEELRKAAR